MPYKDPERQKAAQRKAAAKRREKEKAQQEQEAQAVAVDPADGMGQRPTVEDAEAAYMDAGREKAIVRQVCKSYGKSRTWACVMYQDSAPPDWEDKLRMVGVSFAVSPLHDQDLTADRKLKKPHWHVILDWRAGSTTYATAAGISRGILKGTIPIPLVSPRGYYRYFCHLDNPKKAQYDPKDIITGNGFDIGDFLELTAQEKSELRRKIIENIIIPFEIGEYWDLVVYTMLNEDAATFDFVCTNTHFFQGALRSKSNAGRSEKTVKVKLVDGKNRLIYPGE